MATNLVGNGETVTFTAGSAITSGDLVAFPADDTTAHLVGVAHADYASGATNAVATITGEARVTKAAGTAWAIGDLVYKGAGSQTCSETSTGNAFVGVASRASGSSATTGYVLLNVGGRET